MVDIDVWSGSGGRKEEENDCKQKTTSKSGDVGGKKSKGKGGKKSQKKREKKARLKTVNLYTTCRRNSPCPWRDGVTRESKKRRKETLWVYSDEGFSSD